MADELADARRLVDLRAAEVARVQADLRGERARADAAESELLRTRDRLRTAEAARARAEKALSAARSRRIVRIADRFARIVRAPAVIVRRTTRSTSTSSQAATVRADDDPAAAAGDHPSTGTPIVRGDGPDRRARMLAGRAAATPLVISAWIAPETAADLAPDCTLLDARTDSAPDGSWDLVLIEPASARPGDPPADPLAEPGLATLIEAAHAHGVPTVLWDTAETDRSAELAALGALVDTVLTVDAARIDRLRELCGHDRVAALPYGGQPARHAFCDAVGDVAVLREGWDAAAPAHDKAMRMLVAAADAVLPTRLIDPSAGALLDELRPPQELRRLVAPNLDAPLVELIAPTVTDSASIVPRRVYGLALEGTPMVAAYARGIAHAFGDLLPTADGIDPLRTQLLTLRDDRALREARRRALRDVVLNEHTIAQRLRRLVELVAAVGADPKPSRQMPVAFTAEAWPTIAPVGSGVRCDRVGESLQVRRDGGDGSVDLPMNGRLDVSDAPVLALHLPVTGDLDVRLVVRWRDDAGRMLRTDVRYAGVDIEVRRPEGAVDAEAALRVAGAGTAQIDPLRRGRMGVRASPDPDAAATLVVADAYPSYDDLYRYGFVHSRVRAYRRRGEDVDVFRYRAAERHGWYEFEGVEVETGGVAALRAALERPGRRDVLVHFLSPHLWDILADYVDRLQITVWVHGSDIQPWWRRPWADEAARSRAERITAQRMPFWQRLLADPPPGLRLAFVSRFFMQQALGDLERTVPADRRAVIHNPIDTELFRAEQKDPAQRLRVLSLRPYTGPVYGNDLAVAAVLDLADEPWFDELEFCFVGDGPLFDETLAPLRHLSNVTVQRGYVTQPQIADLHRRFGVFLVPTRSDTHGVSRDEAMASGLVPVTNAVAAVPEFVSEAEGYLAPADDAIGLADAIRDLYHRPDAFVAKSRAAAARVRRQASADLVIPRELAFARGELPADGDEP